MRKFLHWQQFSAATVATVATKFKKQVATLFPQGSNTGSNTHDTPHSLLSRLKTSFYSLVGSNGSNTFPNFAQEKNDLRERIVISPVNDEFADYVPENDGASVYAMDEYDEDDFEERYGSEAGEWEWDYDQYGRMVWYKGFVDDIIDEEEPGKWPPNYDPSSGDIPF